MDHILERSKYPKLEFEEWNILVVTQEEHQRKTDKFPGAKQPLDDKYKEIILKTKKKYNEEKENFKSFKERSQENS